MGPIDWLTKAGLAIKIPVTSQIAHPLKAFCKENLFQLYIFDIGILGAMLELSPEIVLKQDYGTAKGYFAENFVATQLHTAGHGSIYSWNSKNHEIEFVVNINDELTPIEVKAGRVGRAKSLEIVMREFLLKRAIILSSDPIRIKSESVDHFPLYVASAIFGIRPGNL